MNQFCISISWRVLKYFKEDGKIYKHKYLLNEAEFEWREYLLSGNSINKFNKHYFLIVDDDFYYIFRSELYFSRDVDIDIAESDDKCFVYAKFGKFMIIFEISGITHSILNSNLREEIIFDGSEQKIIDKDIIEFFQTRIDSMPEFKDLSKTQQKKNNEYFEKNKERIVKSEYYKILSKYSM